MAGPQIQSSLRSRQQVQVTLKKLFLGITFAGIFFALVNYGGFAEILYFGLSLFASVFALIVGGVVCWSSRLGWYVMCTTWDHLGIKSRPEEPIWHLAPFPDFLRCRNCGPS